MPTFAAPGTATADDPTPPGVADIAAAAFEEDDDAEPAERDAPFRSEPDLASASLSAREGGALCGWAGGFPFGGSCCDWSPPTNPTLASGPATAVAEREPITEFDALSDRRPPPTALAACGSAEGFTTPEVDSLLILRFAGALWLE